MKFICKQQIYQLFVEIEKIKFIYVHDSFFLSIRFDRLVLRRSWGKLSLYLSKRDVNTIQTQVRERRSRSAELLPRQRLFFLFVWSTLHLLNNNECNMLLIPRKCQFLLEIHIQSVPTVRYKHRLFLYYYQHITISNIRQQKYIERVCNSFFVIHIS